MLSRNNILATSIPLRKQERETKEDSEYALFKKQISKLAGIDLSFYKEEQMRRRLNTIMARNRAKNLTEYTGMLERDAGLLGQFKDFFTINVSEFFRNPEKFDELAKKVLPELLKSSSKLNIWSAGCSIGAEPYTVAMILEELTPGVKHRILATDVDATTLAKAKLGAGYTPADVKSVDKRLLQKYFIPEGDQYKIPPKIREKIEFKVHDLLKDKYENEFDLIICRNVVIYFTDEAKNKIYAGFRDGLKQRGVLFIGGTETIMRSASLGLESFLISFYRRAV